MKRKKAHGLKKLVLSEMAKLQVLAAKERQNRVSFVSEVRNVCVHRTVVWRPKRLTRYSPAEELGGSAPPVNKRLASHAKLCFFARARIVARPLDFGRQQWQSRLLCLASYVQGHVSGVDLADEARLASELPL